MISVRRRVFRDSSDALERDGLASYLNGVFSALAALNMRMKSKTELKP
jgi:hypothetical protein